MSCPRTRARADFLASSRGVEVEYSAPFKLAPDPKTNLHGDEVLPLLGKPYFHVVISKVHIEPSYQMVLLNNFESILPSALVPTILTCQGKSWEMLYKGNSLNRKKFDSGWRSFADDNCLKIGDACIFELVECSEEKIIFKVQILRGDIPSNFFEKVNGESPNTPIVID